jgi:hypothetical protein
MDCNLNKGSKGATTAGVSTTQKSESISTTRISHIQGTAILSQ